MCVFSSSRSLYGLYPYKSSMIGMENLGDPSGNWDIVETIGKGTYGKVYRVTNKKDGSQAAVKVLDPINVSQHAYRAPVDTACCIFSVMYVTVASIPCLKKHSWSWLQPYKPCMATTVSCSTSLLIKFLQLSCEPLEVPDLQFGFNSDLVYCHPFASMLHIPHPAASVVSSCLWHDCVGRMI